MDQEQKHAFQNLPTLIAVEKLDWGKLNPELNEYLHKRFPERTDDKWYYDDQYYGLVQQGPICLLITNEACFKPVELFEPIKKRLGFTTGVILDTSDSNFESLSPEFNLMVLIDKINIIR